MTSPLLLALFKVLERLVYNGVLDFLNAIEVLYKYQFGFPKNHSTNLALITLIDFIMSHLDANKSVLGISLDFFKTFDTVNHSVLSVVTLYDMRHV